MKVRHLFIALGAILFAAVPASAVGAPSVASDTSVSTSTTTTTTNSVTDSGDSPFSVCVGSILDNWHVRVGLDMSLQNPYGHSFKNVFPCGKTFGVDVALGKQFTPGLTLRGRVNWENGIRLLRNHHATWLAPFDRPDVNMDRGGYITVTGDIVLDVHNLFVGYCPDRRWNLQVYPSAGFAYNFGVSKGTPLLGIGLGNSYRLDDRYTLFADITYNMVSSGFGGNMDTGTGSNNNGFFNICLGVQIALGKSTFDR